MPHRNPNADIPQLTLREEGKEVNFAVRRMEDIHKSQEGKTEEPHRHFYHTLIWCNSGKGKHRVDFQEHELQAGDVHWVQPGQVHQLVTTESPNGFAILFNEEFLAYNGISLTLVREDPLKDCGSLFVFPNAANDPVLAATMSHLAQSYFEPEERFRWEEWGALLQLLLIGLRRKSKSKPLENPQWQSGNGLIVEFRTLLEKHFSTWHKVSEYAEALHITANYLNDVVKDGVGKTAKQLIQDRISLEAKRLALKSELSNKEVAYALGFEDPSHFSRFFRRCTNQSFSDFRDSLRKKYS